MFFTLSFGFLLGERFNNFGFFLGERFNNFLVGKILYSHAHTHERFLCTAAPILANFLLKIGFWAEMLRAPFFARDV